MSLLLFFIVIWNSHFTYVFVFGKYGYFISFYFKKSVPIFEEGDAFLDVILKSYKEPFRGASSSRTLTKPKRLKLRYKLLGCISFNCCCTY